MSNLKNHLKDATSPYLLQHANNPVDWYPWCEEAFLKARTEDKPIFLSIGYSTCHWCHVMAHESFEDLEIAEILNAHFVSIKVDKEERPDIDSIYMSFCQAFSGSGGWPTSIFMTWDQKPFFAGTYFPKITQLGAPGFEELLLAILGQWEENREALLSASSEITKHLKSMQDQPSHMEKSLIEKAILQFTQHFDKRYGGFGGAPKFPAPHNLLFLMDDYLLTQDVDVRNMFETTLLQMYKGGLFDHIGFGFARYSTDRFFLVPHFEKMLYDNALLILAYAKAFSITKETIYLDIAEKTAAYILREMTHDGGGFYSAHDADSDGIEGKYYVFDYHEILSLLGEKDGKLFCKHYGITPDGNFDGGNIPNLLAQDFPKELDAYLPKLLAYRKKRTALHLDDKILTAWNGMMIAALSYLYRVSGNDAFLSAAWKAEQFLAENLSDNNHLFVSFRDQKHTGKGFLDDYACYAWALLSLYESTLKTSYLDRAIALCNRAVADFHDKERGGFFLYGKHNEQLILTPKETYDGAVPSGNAVMAYLFVRLYNLTGQILWKDRAEKQLAFLSGHAKEYPMGHSFFLSALLLFWNPPDHVVVVLKDVHDLDAMQFPVHMDVLVMEEPSEHYPLLHDKTTYYVCKNHTCYPASNQFTEVRS